MSKAGRPTKSDAERRGELITLRLTVDEIRAVDAAAKKSDLTRSKWLRKILTQAINVLQ